MKIMNTVFTDHLGVETRSSFQSQCHAIETLAMQPRRAAEEPNSIGAPPWCDDANASMPSLTPIPNHPGDVTVTTGSQSEATNIEQLPLGATFGVGVDVVRAPSAVPGSLCGPIVGGIDSETST